MSKCGACGKFLSSIGAASCTICPSLYHKGCVGVPDTATIIKDWVCPDCKRRTKKGDNSTTPIRGICSSTPSTSSQHTTTDMSSEIRDMRRELADYMGELREHRKEMSELRSTLLGLNERLDSVERRLDAVEQGSVSLEKVVKLEKAVEQLKGELNDRDQEVLLTDLDIGNIPEPAGENTVHTITVLASKLGVTLAPADIVFAERVGRNVMGSEIAVDEPKRSRRIVVRLTRRQLRDELLRAARVRRTLSSTDLGVAGAPQRVYVNERLTRHNRQLFHRVREECRRLNWRYSWTKRGRIFARHNDGKQVHLIRTTDDIERVFKYTTV
ncbi:uncharacterized protein LOC126973072 [Leptidea sinapis]|uniref:uncharacterized protein LOC126973072 n=1 Tax=Leptidea sinapis TaxID=189913 RepID=UPI0021C2F86E|nr:uncharacterized protein LOC126973072 [Leptidea sinapis]